MSALCPQGRARDMELVPTRFKTLPRYRLRGQNDALNERILVLAVYPFAIHTDNCYDIDDYMVCRCFTELTAVVLGSWDEENRPHLP